MTLVDINGPGFNYVVKYKRVKDLKWMKTLVGRTEEEFRIPNAGTNKLWYFTLQSNNSEGLGPVCLKSSSYSGQASKFVYATSTEDCWYIEISDKTKCINASCIIAPVFKIARPYAKMTSRLKCQIDALNY